MNREEVGKKIDAFEDRLRKLDAERDEVHRQLNGLRKDLENTNDETATCVSLGRPACQIPRSRPKLSVRAPAS